MGDYRFKHIPEDALVLGVGSLFKKNGNRYWGINLTFSKRLDRSSIPIAGIPLIRRFKTLSAHQSNQIKGKVINFTIQDAQQWPRKHLADCPAFSTLKTARDPNQWCFEINIPNGPTVFLPQLELARVLFLHDNYMSRICLEHGKLSSDFNVTNTTGNWLIDVMPQSTYPLDAYNDERCRRFLSWILIDPDARASFESIHQRMIKERTTENNYQHWDFSFLPPHLKGAKLEVSGWHDWNNNSFFVWEIRRIDNLPAVMPDELDFYHPKFERQVNGQGGGTYTGKPERPDEHKIDDEEDADPDKKRVVLDAESVGLTFFNPFKTNKVTSKTKKGNRGRADESEPGELSDELSPNDGSQTGTIPGADYDVLNDETDDSFLYESKFDCFLEMIERLETNHGCNTHRYPLRKLPKLARCKKHMMDNDANPRCLAVVELNYQGQIYHLVEVDTSDAKNSISTMLMELKDTSGLFEQIAELEIRLLKKSLSWPRDYIEMICGEGNFDGVSHPPSKHKGLIDPADIDRWAERVIGWLDN
jgi:hypothetical protein